MSKTFLLLYFLIILSSCTNQTTYSGKIINSDNLSDINFKNKEILIKKFGYPSFEDPIENKYFYYSEKKFKKHIFNKKTIYSYIFVFKFDGKDKIINSKVYDLTKINSFDIINEETDNELIQRGLIEKVFGGVGAQQELPTSP